MGELQKCSFCGNMVTSDCKGMEFHLLTDHAMSAEIAESFVDKNLKAEVKVYTTLGKENVVPEEKYIIPETSNATQETENSITETEDAATNIREFSCHKACGFTTQVRGRLNNHMLAAHGKMRISRGRTSKNLFDRNVKAEVEENTIPGIENLASKEQSTITVMENSVTEVKDTVMKVGFKENKTPEEQNATPGNHKMTQEEETMIPKQNNTTQDKENSALKDNGCQNCRRDTFCQKLHRFKCEKEGCEYVGNRKMHFNNHKKAIHERRRDLKCGQCPYETSDASNLKRHIKGVHTKVFPYQCNICRPAYATHIKRDLGRHENTAKHKYNAKMVELSKIQNFAMQGGFQNPHLVPVKFGGKTIYGTVVGNQIHIPEYALIQPLVINAAHNNVADHATVDHNVANQNVANQNAASNVANPMHEITEGEAQVKGTCSDILEIATREIMMTGDNAQQDQNPAERPSQVSLVTPPHSPPESELFPELFEKAPDSSTTLPPSPPESIKDTHDSLTTPPPSEFIEFI